VERTALQDLLGDVRVVAGGKAERLGDAAAGRPKPLVPVGGRPLVAWQLGRPARAGVGRAVLAVAAGRGAEFERDLGGPGPEVAVVQESQPLGRGRRLRVAGTRRRGTSAFYPP